MASTSNSTIQKSFKYDVFLSFRGEDTRLKFVSHLYNALEQHGIQTYKDDQKIEKGETINTQLMESIEDSRFFIIVFSKDYAGSSWCLDELVKIMECQKTSEQTAYPVFYGVEPTEVRKQSGEVEKAFEKYKNKEDAGKWRKALNEAADLAGWESKKTANGDESKLIQIIVDDIFKKICSSSPSVDRKLVGMDTRIEDFLSSLELDAHDVRMIGIWGMGGGGKTTLARAVFDRISIRFDGKAFVENVREVSKSSLYGLNKLQQQILRSVLSNGNITVSSVHEGTNMMKRMIRGRKVLIVLDDVDDLEQLEALAGEPDWFKLGSRVIITTRDKQILLAHGVRFIDVNLLSPAEAICLLSKNAFKREIPIEGYDDVSEQVVKYADGLPLTIKVLGSMLYGQNEPQWIDTLERLKKIPLKATMEKLELSYIDLEEDHKEIFLDVACIHNYWMKDEAIIALESCGFHARIGLRVLELKSLITISEDGYLGMHDHIKEMGKNIVRRVNPNKPEMHSRLWIKDEIVDILANDSGTQATKCITLDAEELDFKILKNGLANMKELRFLHVFMEYLSEAEITNWGFDEVGLYLPNALRFLKWSDYPFSTLPKTFQAKDLVGLDMYLGNMAQLWKDGEEKACLNLRFLNFTYLFKLRTLDLSVAPNLETLILEDCTHLVEVHFQVTPNLKELRIFGCDRLEILHMPAESPKLRSLDLKNLKLTTLHLGITPNLETLNLKMCTNHMVELGTLADCPKLVNLGLNFVMLRTSLDLGLTPNLESLNLKHCYDLEEINAPAGCLKKLLYLGISYCGRFKCFEFDNELISLYELYLIADADDTGICDPGNTWPEFQFSCYYKEDPASRFGNLERLISLGFGARINVDSFSDIICGLQCLRKLTLEGGIPEAPKNLDQLDCLEELSLCYTDIKTLPDSICMLKHLKSLVLESCLLLEKLPDDLGQLKSLEELNLHKCLVLRDIPNSICEMKRLKYFYLSNCILVETLPEEIGRLEYLIRLAIEGTSIRHLPQSIFRLEGLCISGSTEILESCGLTSEIQTNENKTFCYI